MPEIHTAALGVIVQDGHVLLSRLAPWLGAGRRLRPIGGLVEFGERSSDAVVREFREELGRSVEVVRLLDVYEMIATLPAASVHGTSFLYLLRFAYGHAPTNLAPLPLFEEDAPQPERDDWAEWVPFKELRAGRHAVFPHDLVARLGVIE